MAPIAAATVPAVSALPGTRSVPAAATASPMESSATTPVSQRLLDWVGAWTAKDVTRYLSFYDPKFQPTGVPRAVWFANRTKLLKKDGEVELKIANVQRRTVSADTVETKFEQHYSSKDFKDKSQKTLTWKRRGADWYIVKESNR